ncbi:hypothetical protein NMV19_11230 [Pasteurella multocida]|uniref:hypothetical protein n=1 Tax=Pasteurella multocida TaxID=747 RepID=UPI002A53202B|nr:hypothetical protein [Pasteurella multocida]MDY0523017.1 hypothetical protein [Pasteurella multocida]MDY0609083.1 hypothetical protein [Pasteurella multocida]MDY0616956.1 hypothetical protein [Pasteurella multocida]MDY0649403.1 hypothetical protein [Pasteurella multocida]
MDLVKNLLEKHDFKIYSSPPGFIWSKRDKDNTSIVCSFNMEVMTVSISHGGARNPRKAKKIIKSIFGDSYRCEQQKVISASAVYFNLTRLN